jgi:hypothetical protein
MYSVYSIGFIKPSSPIVFMYCIVYIVYMYSMYCIGLVYCPALIPTNPSIPIDSIKWVVFPLKWPAEGRFWLF